MPNKKKALAIVTLQHVFYPTYDRKMSNKRAFFLNIRSQVKGLTIPSIGEV